MENTPLSSNEDQTQNSSISLDGLSSRAIEQIKTELDDDMFKQSVIDDLTILKTNHIFSYLFII